MASEGLIGEPGRAGSRVAASSPKSTASPTSWRARRTSSSLMQDVLAEIDRAGRRGERGVAEGSAAGRS